MSGRAGRRGIDARGTVVLLLSEKLSVEECRPMMQGGSLPLCSSFRLRYDTLLKLDSTSPNPEPNPNPDPEPEPEPNPNQVQHAAQARLLSP